MRKLVICIDDITERYGRYLPRDVQGCYRLLWCSRWLLRKYYPSSWYNI